MTHQEAKVEAKEATKTMEKVRDLSRETVGGFPDGPH